MNRILLLLVFASVLSACNGQQSDAKKLKKDIEATMKVHTPGTIGTSATGYYMKAKIDGKDWVAVSMMPIEGIDRAIGYTGDGGYISLPGMKKNRPQGFTLTLGGAYGADIYIVGDKSMIDKDGNAILLDKQEGRVEITKRDGEWIEGTFYFTASSSRSDKKVRVTDGYFRIR